MDLLLSSILLIGNNFPHILLLDWISDRFMPAVSFNESSRRFALQNKGPLTVAFSSAACAEASKRPQKDREFAEVLIWQRCSSLLSDSPVASPQLRERSPRSLKQLSMSVRLGATALGANCMGGYDKVGWHIASGGVQMLTNRTGCTVWPRMTLNVHLPACTLNGDC